MQCSWLVHIWNGNTCRAFAIHLQTVFEVHYWVGGLFCFAVVVVVGTKWSLCNCNRHTRTSWLEHLIYFYVFTCMKKLFHFKYISRNRTTFTVESCQFETFHNANIRVDYNSIWLDYVNWIEWYTFYNRIEQY